MAEPRLFVLGNAGIDTTLNVPRLPLPGETLMATGIARAPGGKGLNQAVVAARCGVPVHFLAPLGTEPETRIVRDALAEAGLAACDLPDVGQPTDLSTLLVAPNAENCIVSTGACAEALPAEAALGFVAGMHAGDMLLMQGNLSEAATLAAARAAPHVVLNTAPLRWDYARVLPECDLVVANRLEAEMLTGLSDPFAAAGRLRGIVTIGAEGCVVAGLGAMAPPPVRAVDSTGAGDTFCGVLAACLLRGTDLRRAVEAALAAAALAVTRAGCFTALPRRAELAAIIAR